MRIDYTEKYWRYFYFLTTHYSNNSCSNYLNIIKRIQFSYNSAIKLQTGKYNA